MKEQSCSPECDSAAKCDIFDFMAKHVGMTVIHPGGFKATDRLLSSLNITPESKVIDIACGKGTSAIFIAKKYGCNVVAIDIDAKLIDEARILSRKGGFEDKITFHVGDALKLPFHENEFDVAVSQAMLVLVDDKIKAIQEANRVIKKGGYAGWLELSWKKDVSKEFIEELSKVICAYCMTNVSTYDGWRKLFHEAGIQDLNVVHLDFDPTSGSPIEMIRDEGFLRSIHMIIRINLNKDIKNRMKRMRRFFKENRDIFGCGIYFFRKT